MMLVCSRKLNPASSIACSSGCMIRSAAARNSMRWHALRNPMQWLAVTPVGAQRPRSLSTGSSFTDIRIQEQSWIHYLLPAAAAPYAALGRWDRPIGTWLLLWPCLWSTALAASPGALPDLWLCGLFGVGSFAMRGAGCTINDLWDRDIDRQVERTRMRPLASGALGVPQAIGFLDRKSVV